MKKIIFTQRVEVIEAYNERRDCADQRITQFIQVCGFLPVPVPNNPDVVRCIVNEINPAGIILVGGNSLVKYGGNAPERDETDKTLLQIAVDGRIPLYGFCRGMQSILDYFGNDLINVKGHVAVRHKIYGSEDEIEVNSYHNQACTMLKSDELVVIMKSEDGVIEKVKHRSLPLMGTMWHPERENPFRNTDIDLLQTFMGGQE